jgi:hypothetical protein
MTVYTEEEAANHRCPVGQAMSHITCCGSGCMAWRWILDDFGIYTSMYGYCGLAGEPRIGSATWRLICGGSPHE